MNEIKVVKRAQQGDKEAFVQLIEQHRNSMYRMALTIVHSKEACEDALSEAITKAYEKITTLREPKYFKTWLMRIVMNESYSIVRERKRVVELTEWNREVVTETLTTDFELEEVIQQLPEDLRVVIVLFYIEQWTISEMSEVLNVAEGTVKSRLHRARKKLMPLLETNEKRCSTNE
ncbi:MAG: sigma-70 family RNA polymerase sigma factor [Bacillaceae bacterium]|nr:sigma-70 family RNA polymerase sigma factor [Bacillaceae bacterium]